MMRFIVLFLLCFLSQTAFSADYSDKVKLLEQHGVPYFYNQDIANAIEKWSLNENNKTSDVLGRSVNWFREMELAQKTHGLPWFIKFIPAANTGYNHLYDGIDGSKGMWPLSFAIGKKYGLKQNSYIDERRDVVASSEAACRYLSDLNNIYRDWLKTITAFRIGAIRLNQVIRLAGNSLDFKDIYDHLEPDEREPVIQFYAAVTVMYFRHDFKIQETVFNKITTDTVTNHVAIPYAFLEEKLKLGIPLLRELNPQFSADLVPWFGTAGYFKIPAEKKPEYNRMRDSIELFLQMKNQPPMEYDTVVEVRDSVMYVSLKPKNTDPPAIDSAAVSAKVWVWYRVKPGDGFYTLSDVFDCSMDQMKLWNGIRNNTLKANTLVKFYVPADKLQFYKSINGMNATQKKEVALRD